MRNIYDMLRNEKVDSYLKRLYHLKNDVVDAFQYNVDIIDFYYYILYFKKIKNYSAISRMAI